MPSRGDVHRGKRADWRNERAKLESDGYGYREGLFRQNKRKEGWRQMEKKETGVRALVKVLGLPPPSRSTQVCGSPAPH